MAGPFQDRASLGAHRAFVVHFAAGGDGARRRFRGRVEHLASGRAAQFPSLARLVDFIGAVLDGTDPDDPLSRRHR
jgi:hypothetical protein